MKHLKSDWWQSFSDQTKQLEKPALFKGSCDSGWNYLVDQLFWDIQANEQLILFAISKIRIYVNGGLRKDLGLKFLKFKRNENESFHDWCCRYFENNQFLIVFSDFSTINDEITIEFSLFLKSFFEICGVPRFTQLTLFVGNYGYTPFGIHVDTMGLKAIHLHLGPGRKRMFLWDQQSLPQDKLGLMEYVDPADFTSTATTDYVIEAGDIFYFPVDRFYHIGSNVDEFSCAISVGFSNLSFKEVIGRNLTTSISQVLDKGDWLPLNSINDISEIREIFSCNRLRRMLMSNSSRRVFDFQNLIYIDFLLKVSNFGFFHSLGKPAVNHLSKGSYIKLVAPFKIYYVVLEDLMVIIARGHYLRVAHDLSLIKIIDRINSAVWLKTGKLFMPLLKKYPEKYTFDIVSFLGNVSAVAIKNEEIGDVKQTLL